jgi:TRAP transporter TAXI family solute receptor
MTRCSQTSAPASSTPAASQQASTPAVSQAASQPASSSQKAPEKKFYTLAASNAPATAYPYWVAVGKAISSAYPELDITVSESQGTLDCINRVRVGDAVFGNGDSKSLYDDYKGINSFDGDPYDKARLLWFFDTSTYNVFVAEDTDIKDFAGLEGQKISLGGTNTTNAAVMTEILKTLNISVVSYEASKTEAGDAYANRIINGVPSTAPQPDSYIVQANAARQIRLLSLTPEQQETIVSLNPSYGKTVVPAGTYKGVDYDVNCITMSSGCHSTSDLPQEDGYKFIKAVYSDEGKAIWGSTLPTALKADWQKLALGSPVPLHAGTVQYLTELGVSVPANLIPPEYVPVK